MIRWVFNFLFPPVSPEAQKVLDIMAEDLNDWENVERNLTRSRIPVSAWKRHKSGLQVSQTGTVLLPSGKRFPFNTKERRLFQKAFWSMEEVTNKRQAKTDKAKAETYRALLTKELKEL